MAGELWLRLGTATCCFFVGAIKDRIFGQGQAVNRVELEGAVIFKFNLSFIDAVDDRIFKCD